MVGAHHYRTTAYHPQANSIVERLHRQLKASIMCHATAQWTEALPLVLLGIRSTWKADIEASSAELVYGESLRLPGQFLNPTDEHETADVTNLATRLRHLMANLSPKQTSWHRKKPFYIPPYVFLRQDFVRKPLDPPCAGSYKVLERHPKFYKLDVRGKCVTVSIDRLKPAYVSQEAEDVPTAQSTQASSTVATSIPASPQRVSERHEMRTRSGRRVRFTNFYRPQ